MPKLCLDPGVWREPRFARMCYAMGFDKPTGVGVLAMFWASTRDAELTGGHISVVMDHLPVDAPLREKLVAALRENGYLTNIYGERYEIPGNAEWVELQDKRRASGRMGRTAMVANLHRGRKILSSPQESAQMAWGMYRLAYKVRYGVEPVRNAKTNSILAQIVTRVGIYDAPETVQFYVEKSDTPTYAACRHDLAVCLRDIEALHSAWQSDITASWTFMRAEEQRAKKAEQLELVS